MVIYMRHPQHGTKIAIAEAEAVADEANGWVREDAGALLTPAVPVLAPAPAERPKLTLRKAGNGNG
jgi:hypothetical protein